MATGRTLERWARIYSDGYDLSGYARKLGDLKWEHAAPADLSLTDAVKSVVSVDQATFGIGPVNVFLDNTATLGPHINHYGAGVKRTVMVAQGIRAVPAQGDPVYCAQVDQLDYKASVDNGIVVATLTFGDADPTAAAFAYSKPWGVLLAPLLARIGANTAAGVDCGEETTTAGGYMMYQITAWNGTGNITLSVEEADTNTNGSFAAMDPALTTAALAHTLGPTAGVVALATTQTVKQYTRFQLALGGGLTGATFALAFVRG